jgi:hypothetical protein
MKKYLFFFWISTAQAAGVVAEGKTPTGTIALTDDPCGTMPYTKVAYQYTADGKTVLGCWASDQSRVFVAWNDLTLTSYSHNFFNTKEIK